MTSFLSRKGRTAAACAVTLGLGLTLTAAVPAVASSSTTDQQRAQYEAEQVHHFLEGFYGNHGPRPWERENLVAEDLKRRAGEIKEYDLLLCSQNVPKDITVGEVTTAQSAGVGWASIWLSWGAGHEVSVFTAYVDLDADKPLKLLDVACAPPEIP
ncbi:hypothetical protein [Streptomyces sp. JJ38]|uniref:hypothetical protein n=1 Tax=Streptomyces sp. JJ38 TaxID=2738128 RepID=UPI001C56CF25|nr:hypothetical protein [Streptomyces sp. JJ38]MBW1598562.1 hypothetical protein [Streptomyces sp. JJ38]